MQIYLICPKLDNSSPVKGVIGLFSHLSKNYSKKINFFEFSFRSGVSQIKLFKSNYFVKLGLKEIVSLKYNYESRKKLLISFCFRADFLAYLLKNKKLCWIALVRCNIFSLYEIESRLGWVKKRIHIFILKRADKILVSSLFLKLKFEEFGFTNVYCVGSAEYSFPLSNELSHVAPPKKSIVLGYFGGDSRNKGINLILSCIRKVNDLNNLLDVSFIIGGRFHDRRIIERLGTNRFVNFVGFCDVNKYLQQIDILIIPSYSEGSSRLGLEALSLNIPFIFRSGIGLEELWHSRELASKFSFSRDDELIVVLERALKSVKSLRSKSGLLNAFYSPQGHSNAVWAIISEIQTNEG
ncbi:glycosyltransferase [Litoricolaceae bacterium]|nr:glycosyltransferase [Litorivicinaceae bacterium]